MFLCMYKNVFYVFYACMLLSFRNVRNYKPVCLSRIALLLSFIALFAILCNGFGMVFSVFCI